MNHWTTHVACAGTVDETEVHCIELKTITVDVSREKGAKLWTISMMRDDEVIGEQVVEETLLSAAKVRAMVIAIDILNNDCAALAETMQAMEAAGEIPGKTGSLGSDLKS